MLPSAVEFNPIHRVQEKEGEKENLFLNLLSDSR